MSRLPRYVRRRWARRGLFGLLLLVTLALARVLLGSDQAFGEDQLLTWVGLLVSLAALAVSVADVFPPLPPPRDSAELAEDLAVAVREQWEEEVTVRQLRNPRVIPLSWAATGRPVAAAPDGMVSSVGGRVLRLSFDGRLDGRFDAACVSLAEQYERVASGRLVVLGEPGAGKTVLAAMLTLGLLSRRAPLAPVPVLLQVSGWDPVSVSLNDWTVAELARAYYGGREDVPRRLLEHRRLLVVLDGLDEMHESHRRTAVRAINDTCGEDRGVVVTCRSAEYEDVIQGGSPVLRRAPVVEVAPVSVTDGIAYLNEVSWPEHVAWEPVHQHLRTEPDGPLAAALSTPLALTLARTVYRNTGRDPAELLAFDSRHAVEDHLVDHLVTAAYAPAPGSCGEQADDAWLRKARRAERYLTFLATYLHQQRERELQWWLLDRRLLPRSTGTVVGIAVMLISVVVIVIGIDVVDGSLYAGGGIVSGIVTGALASGAWYAAPRRPPGRLSFTRIGSLKRMRKGFTSGLKLTAMIGGTVALTVIGFVLSQKGWNHPSATKSFRSLAFVAASGIAVSFALASHALFDAPPARATSAGPRGLLRQDRASSLVGALTAGVALAVALGPLTALLSASASLGVLFIIHQPGDLPPGALEQFPDLHQVYDGVWGWYGDSTTADFLAWITPSAMLALLILLTRPWTRFVLLRLFLAAQGRLPWQLMRFLSEAREHQLLRQSAGSYQFRHIRLQERLAGRSLAQDRVPAPAGHAGRRRIRWAVAFAVPLLVAAGTLRYSLPEDRSVRVLNTGDTAFASFVPGTSGTLVTVDRRGSIHHWNTLTGEEETTGSPQSIGEHPFVGMAREDGLLMIDGDESRLFPWDGARGRPSHNIPHLPKRWVVVGGRYALTFVGRLADRENRVQVIDMTTGKPSGPACDLPDRFPFLWQNGLRYEPVAISSAGTRIAISHGSVVHIFDEKCVLRGKIPAMKNVYSLAFNNTGTKLAVVVKGSTWVYEM